jgi:integrin beta 1
MISCPWVIINITLVLILVTTVGTSQISDEWNVENSCNNKVTCSECIQESGCTWCMQRLMDKPRCCSRYLPNAYCGEEYQFNPNNEQRTLSMLPGLPISPQKIGLKLRINEKHRIQVHYSQFEDYPLDLYFLMDLSKSMEDEKENLIKLGDLLAHTMRNTTANLRIGFGGFVRRASQKLENNCSNCDKRAYAFINIMRLSWNIEMFSEQVRQVSVSGNSNSSGGGLDAVMQAIVCRYKIDWRENARRVLVFATNGDFHSPDNDSVVPPNDGLCHVDNRGLYTHSSVQQYPSISQIDTKIKENYVKVIFAVTPSQFNVYTDLTRALTGSSSAILSNDSSNVVELVREEYSKISSSVELKDNAASPIKITYSSSCLNNWRQTIETNKCDRLRVGDVVTFTAEFVVTSCPQNKEDWKQIVQIYPVGVNQSLIIDFEMICDCPCEHSNHPQFEINSPKCRGFGTYKCGICECDKFHNGQFCEMAVTTRALEPNNHCKAHNLTLIDCSGRGICVGGFCECDKRFNHDEVISGQYCQCDNFSCNRENGLLCSGPDHGTCSCGVCQCYPGWSGDACGRRGN